MLDLRRIERRHRRACDIHTGFSFGVGGRCGGASFDPATLNLTGWWRASYSGSPWSGTASAGSSGSRNLTEATNPPGLGASINSLTPADFNGTNQVLSNSLTFDNFISNTAGTIVVLFKATSAATDAGATSPHQNPALVASTAGGYVTLGFSTSGVRFGTHNGTSLNSIAVACGTGAWHLGWAAIDSTNIYAAIDSGSFSSTAWTLSSSFNTDTFRVGSNYNGSKWFTGQIAEIMTMASAVTGAQQTNIVSYINARYALSL